MCVKDKAERNRWLAAILNMKVYKMVVICIFSVFLNFPGLLSVKQKPGRTVKIYPWGPFSLVLSSLREKNEKKTKQKRTKELGNHSVVCLVTWVTVILCSK